MCAASGFCTAIYCKLPFYSSCFVRIILYTKFLTLSYIFKSLIFVLQFVSFTNTCGKIKWKGCWMGEDNTDGLKEDGLNWKIWCFWQRCLRDRRKQNNSLIKHLIDDWSEINGLFEVQCFLTVVHLFPTQAGNLPVPDLLLCYFTQSYNHYSQLPKLTMLLVWVSICSLFCAQKNNVSWFQHYSIFSFSVQSTSSYTKNGNQFIWIHFVVFSRCSQSSLNPLGSRIKLQPLRPTPPTRT